MSAKKVYLSLGTNLGDRQQNLQNAIAGLDAAGIRVTKSSSIYETAPRDFERQPWFLNMVVQCDTSYFPMQLLAVTQRLELQLGRERNAGVTVKGPRLIDIDILLYGRRVIESQRLIVPHPRLIDRRFMLQPLVEINEKLKHPVTGRLFSHYLLNVTSQVLHHFSEVIVNKGHHRNIPI